MYKPDYKLNTFYFLSFSELPRPSLGELDDLKLWSEKVRREKNPNVLGYTYQELMEFDVVKVELVPEKKGLIIKHVEYEVTSRVSQSEKVLTIIIRFH